MELCLSVEEELLQTAKKISEICASGSADRSIFGSSRNCLGVVTEGLGRRPNCTSGLIIESEPTILDCYSYGKCQGREYQLNFEEDHIEALKVATVDELDLYMYLADPGLINNALIQKHIRARMEELHTKTIKQASRLKLDTKELERNYQKKMEAYETIFNCYADAKMSEERYGTYFPGPQFTDAKESEDQ